MFDVNFLKIFLYALIQIDSNKTWRRFHLTSIVICQWIQLNYKRISSIWRKKRFNITRDESVVFRLLKKKCFGNDSIGTNFITLNKTRSFASISINNRQTIRTKPNDVINVQSRISMKNPNKKIMSKRNLNEQTFQKLLDVELEVFFLISNDKRKHRELEVDLDISHREIEKVRLRRNVDKNWVEFQSNLFW